MESKADQELRDAYENTDYKILTPSVSIQLNQKNPILDKWLEEKNFSTWAFISAFNPYSILLPDEKNLESHTLLQEKISGLGFSYLEGKAESSKGDFPHELSLFIFGITKESSFAIAKEFEQNAFLFGEIYKEAEILYTE